MEFWNWIGRFHPILVHLPIGFIVLGVIIQYMSRNPRRENWKVLIKPVFFLSFCASLVSVIVGLLLAREGSYNPDTLFWHKWLGIGILALAFLLWRMRPGGSGKLTTMVGVFTLLLLTFVGHLGGKMTHGKDYLLENAPGFVKKLASYEGNTSYETFLDPDSTVLYEDLIQPFVDQKCVSCHNAKVSKGGLDLSTKEGILEGGRDGAVIEASAQQSELFSRVTMNPSSRKYMPPSGLPLSYQEIKLLEWWINSGASFEQTVTGVEVPEDVKRILIQRHKLDTKPKTFLEKNTIEPLDSSLFAEIEAAGFSIKPISQTTNFVEVRWKGIDSLSINDQISALDPAKSHIAWLYLAKSGIENDALKSIGEMDNLLRLKLENNPQITDEGIENLTNLKNLSSLNLYNTKISDLCAPYLASIQSLTKLYIWQTDLGEEGINTIKSKIPDVEVIGGYEYTESN